MASTNIWQQFKAMITEGARVVATMTANNGNSTSQAELRDGSVITVKGESLDVDQKAFIQDEEIKGTAPSWRSMRWRFEIIKIRFSAQFYYSL
ncbi:hypothetical protein J7438_06570 [Thalassotalea sp. G20_0]|uniref:hypothetical protein n=1 Tax=Thalassotalea sp. G20_0 TaxID=2821093 RepID=UPI001ADB2B35|nr:hypothetical protein [Thalassotalea sp. G20_0]MBO9493749.1 hypothetical protein [Thalassotalea sp. G20_0]